MSLGALVWHIICLKQIFCYHIQIVKMLQLLLLHKLVELQLFYSILVVWLCTGKFSRTFRIFSNLGTPYENQIEESNCCLNPLTNIKALSNKYFLEKKCHDFYFHQAASFSSLHYTCSNRHMNV